MDISALRKEHKRSQTEDLPRITFNPTPINATSDGNAEGDVYSYAMTLFEIFAYGTEALSQTNTDRMERNVLKARPSLGPLVWLSPPRPRYFETLINQSALQQPPRQDDVQMALKSIRMSLHAANLRIHRLAEVRAWFDAQYRTQCIQIALTFLGAVPEGNLSPLTASQRQTIFSAMFSDIRDMFALSANIHLQPAQPRADDTITITRVPTIFEEPRVRVLIRALSEPLKLHFQNLAAIARYNLQAEPIPFAVNLT
ncbi:hypothetical protein BOTBODRAFT_35425 [Botryobasidium botryosum FD-172 SS1]|uniref:Protein kinase domain-containing protein n=1 Tax=Botryobasidium botryosum (strain FD-172 SS1) TaxID=930990 RepID=A0A067M9J3_BOTB1|nr:hypothetical protein BOTBODRAFT_35425 [Botryobasidium botryosum FD-172 SS1]